MSLPGKIFRAMKRVNLAIEPTLRHAWVYFRAVYFIRIRKKLRTLNSEYSYKTTVMHNMRSLYGANNRMNLLLFPLSVIETLNADARILVIGPRNENDLYSLVGLGFKLKNIVGLDLISYSPRIELGDMHAMPFPDASFDAVVCGWTMSYSANPRKAAGEIRRVAKAGGVVAIGVEYSTMTLADEVKLLGYAIQDSGRRVNSSADIRDLFGEAVGTVYFEHDAPNRVSHTASQLVQRVSNVALIFQVVRSAPTSSGSTVRSSMLEVVDGPIKPSLAIRAWHRFQERVRPPRARRILASTVARLRPRAAFDQRPEDATLQADGVALMPGFLSRSRAQELRQLLEDHECVDPWKPTTARFRCDAAPPNTHVADIPAAPTIAALHELALDPRLLRLVTVYFGCRPFLDSIQAWWSLSGNEEPEEAEKFHRDNDSIRFLKFFLYLSDVDDENGPHKFVVGSHREGKLLERRRLTDAEVEGTFGLERIKEITGAAGDAFMEDTWGVHKGQLPKSGRRLLAQFRYSIMPTVFRSPLIVKPLRGYDERCVTSLLYQR